MSFLYRTTYTGIRALANRQGVYAHYHGIIQNQWIYSPIYSNGWGPGGDEVTVTSEPTLYCIEVKGSGDQHNWNMQESIWSMTTSGYDQPNPNPYGIIAQQGDQLFSTEEALEFSTSGWQYAGVVRGSYNGEVWGELPDNWSWPPA